MRKGGLAGLALLASCYGPSQEAKDSLAQVQRDGRALDEAFDALEGKLLGSQAVVHQWSELARRHQRVSVLACVNATDQAIQTMALRQQERQKERRFRAGAPLVHRGGVGGPAP